MKGGITIFAVIGLFIGINSHAQQFHPTLSPSQVSAINAESDPAKRLKLYKKTIGKETRRQLKALEKSWDARADSVTSAVREREQAIDARRNQLEDAVGSKIHNTVYRPWAKRQASRDLQWLDHNRVLMSNSLRLFVRDYLEAYYLAATQNDSVLSSIHSRFPAVEMPESLRQKISTYNVLKRHQIDPRMIRAPQELQALNPYITNARQIQSSLGDEISGYSQYAAYARATPDSLLQLGVAQTEKLAMRYLSDVDGFAAFSEGRSGMAEMKAMHARYAGMMETLQDSAAIREQAKQKAEEMAMDYLASNPAPIQAVQKKMSLLMKKYSVVPNVNDLSTAVKRTSLKGRSFRERLVFALNLQPVTLEPVTLDVSPMAGYRLNTKFVIGIGGNYRRTFSDSVSTLAPSVMGYKAFTSYDVLRNFFAYAEFARNTTGVEIINDQAERSWRNAAFLGVGRTMRIYRKLDMTCVFLYNLLYENPDPVYPRRWFVRMGIQRQ